LPVHNFLQPRGRLERVELRSEALRHNRLGDPAERTIFVYLAPGYDEVRDHPLFVGLAGFTSSGPKMLGWRSFGENVPQRIDRLIEQRRMGPVVAAFPDGFTSLGGNQYVDSQVTGLWETFLLEEMIPALAQRFHISPEPAGRAVFGKSSGGYGALVQALRHGDRWGAVACHSADINFDLCYRPDMPKALDALAPHGGEVARFVEHLRGASKISGREMHALMLLAMAASYDPAVDSPHGVRLPVDPHTCELIERRWERWLEHDPLRMVERPDCQERLRRLRLLYLDCGSRDQYALHYGSRAFVRRLERLGIDHVYEEFDDDHSGIDYRLDRSFPLLYRALSGRR
jgi:hypothetical protein